MRRREGRGGDKKKRRKKKKARGKAYVNVIYGAVRLLLDRPINVASLRTSCCAQREGRVDGGVLI